MNLSPVSRNFNIEYEIEKRFILFLRKMFENDPDFKYNENDEKSEIIISTDYPELGQNPLLVPHIIITGINVAVDPNMTFFGNFLRDVENENGLYEYEEHLYQFIYSLSFACWASNNSICKNLSMKICQKTSMTDFLRISELLNLHINGSINRSQISMIQQFPNKIFGCTLGFNGNMGVLNRLQQADIFWEKQRLIVSDINVQTKIDKKS